MSKQRTYWEGHGTLQKLYTKLQKLMPLENSVKHPRKNKALEKLRKASNCYYDLFNNGLCNRATQFRQVFGFSGREIEKSLQYNLYCEPLENTMDDIILAAAKEQGITE